jgi:hypothetical protein
VLAAQLQFDRTKVPYEQLVISDRLRHALGKHVLDAQKKAARKPRVSVKGKFNPD